MPTDPATRDADALLALITATAGRRERVRHVQDVPARAADEVDWPGWVDPGLRSALTAGGMVSPWRHQIEAATLARNGQDVVISTGTASGKSLGYLLPAVSAVLAGATDPTGRGAGVLYLSPTKALAADQLARLQAWDLPGLRAATHDGDTPPQERRWIREHANYVLTNPDTLHHVLLPGHARWASFLRSLRYVVVDECHIYRGVFGSHVAAVLRRLRRIAARYGADPVVVLASATTGDPEQTAARLVGRPVTAVTRDGSPRGRTAFALWEPPLLPGGGERGAPTRRSATAETADLLADLVAAGTPTLAFVRSRRGAEAVAASTRRLLTEVDPALAGRVAAYRGGYLPEERRALEERLRNRELLAMATTPALELGVDVTGLDAVLLAGWPGTRASVWQQAGRAGRAGQDALAVLVASDDPLDTYLVHHPELLFGEPVEATVLDPDNPYVLAPHLCAAAAELPLTEADIDLFGPTTRELLRVLVQRGALRRRQSGWYWTRQDRASSLADLRGTGGEPIRVVEAATGRVLGTVDAAGAHHSVHTGAIYLHQGAVHEVSDLDLTLGVAEVSPAPAATWTTQARDVTEVRVVRTDRQVSWGAAELSFGVVDVTSQVVAYLRRDLTTQRVIDERPLELPSRTLRTAGVWWTLPADVAAAAGVEAADLPGAAHAAEHAAIGLLPLVASCDRWDVGGVSTALHPDTGLPTVVVHDGHPGGAGFAERGFHLAHRWLSATRDAVAACECESGCPSCVQSPKCGNGNDPLDKAGAIRLLDAVLAGAPEPGD